jgi:hypothetical protein
LNLKGNKEVLGLLMNEAEGAKFRVPAEDTKGGQSDKSEQY